jgi:hypothetical protein
MNVAYVARFTSVLSDSRFIRLPHFFLYMTEIVFVLFENFSKSLH